MSTSEIRHGFLGERVAARAAQLSPSELRVARFLADHPEEAAFASAEELGRATGTSDATVVRTIKTLGYDGLPALKRLLQETLRDRLTPASRLERSLDTMGGEPETLLTKALDEQIRLLELAHRTVDPASFRSALELICGARHTVFVAIGVLGHLAEYAVTRLSRIGYPCSAATTSGFVLADKFLKLDKDDIIVAIVHTNVTTEARVAFNRANEVGARIVLLTDTLAEALSDDVSVSLTTPIGQTGTFSAQTTTLAVLEALVLGVAAHDRNRATASMTLLNEIRTQLGAIRSTAAGAELDTGRRTREPEQRRKRR